MAKVHNDLLVNHNQIHSAIGNDKLADARELLCHSIRMIDDALGGKTAVAHDPASEFDRRDPLEQPKPKKGNSKKGNSKKG